MKPLKKNSLLILLLINALWFLSSCGTLAPLKEREAALTSIGLAAQAEANRLAQQEFVAAEGEFSVGEENIDREKKSSKNAKAKKSYKTAKSNADRALRLALMTLIDETQEVIDSKNPATLDDNRQALLKAAISETENARTYLADSKYNQTLDSIREARRLLAEINRATPAEIRKNVENSTDVTLIKETPRYYIVKLRRSKRDSLWRISENLLVDPFRWKDIYALNTHLIKDPDLIYPGQRILIPKK